MGYRLYLAKMPKEEDTDNVFRPVLWYAWKDVPLTKE